MVKRRKQRRKAVHTEADAATPQTRAKLKRDTIEELAYRKTIGPAQEQAADEIHAVFTARTAQLFTKTQDLDRIHGGHSTADWTAALVSAAKRYDEWAAELSAAHTNGGPPLLPVCIAIIIDGHTGNDVDRDYRQRKGTACKWLVQALTRYAEMHGFLRNHKAA